MTEEKIKEHQEELWNEQTWENLDASERRDPELIREYLNAVLVRFREWELKAENE